MNGGPAPRHRPSPRAPRPTGDEKAAVLVHDALLHTADHAPDRVAMVSDATAVGVGAANPRLTIAATGSAHNPPAHGRRMHMSGPPGSTSAFLPGEASSADHKVNLGRRASWKPAQPAYSSAGWDLSRSPREGW